MSSFHLLEVTGHDSETQFQVGENLNLARQELMWETLNNIRLITTDMNGIVIDTFLKIIYLKIYITVGPTYRNMKSTHIALLVLTTYFK